MVFCVFGGGWLGGFGVLGFFGVYCVLVLTGLASLRPGGTVSVVM